MSPPSAWVVRGPHCELRPVLADADPESLALLAARVETHDEDAVPDPARRDHARRTVQRSARAFAAWGYGLWWIMPAGAAEPAGWCGLKDGDDPTRPELMYGLRTTARGTGLASEAVRAAVAYAFRCPGVVGVWGATRPENSASAGVMLRAGLLVGGRRTLDGREYLVFGTGDWPAGS